jgi:hypothetical protein
MAQQPLAVDEGLVLIVAVHIPAALEVQAAVAVRKVAVILAAVAEHQVKAMQVVTGQIRHLTMALAAAEAQLLRVHPAQVAAVAVTAAQAHNG